MGYTASDAISRVKLKGFLSTSGSLSDQQILDLLNDSLDSYIVPISKTLRNEWWVGKSDIVITLDADSKFDIPDTVASTLRTIYWNDNSNLVPLVWIEPENAYQYQNMGSSNTPYGFVLRGYSVEVLPKSPGVQLHLTAMLRPPEMVLEENAAEITGLTSGHGVIPLSLASVPLAWQESTPTQVDIISGTSPYVVLGTGTVVSIDGDTLILSLDTTGLPADPTGCWVSDVGTSPFPNIPIELHPLLVQHTVVQLYQSFGDKRYQMAEQIKKELEDNIKSTMAPRVQGASRPIVNNSAPGMGRVWRRGY